MFKPGQILRWGILGCGDVTEVKSGPAYQKTAGFELAAVMRRSAEKAQDYAHRHGVKKYYSNADALIEDTSIDAIYISTPPDTHKLYGLKVAAAGKPCCIEKPLAPSYADSLAILEAFEQKQLPLFVAYYRRTLPRFLKIKEWLDAGKIGPVRHLEWQLCQPPSAADRAKIDQWRTDARVAPGGYFDDLASHGLNLFTYFFGAISTASGVSLNQQQLYTSKDAISGVWQHENGITGMGNWNFGSATRADHVKIYGSEGHLEFSVFDEHPIRFENATEFEQLSIPHPEHVHLPHVEQMRTQLFDPHFQHPSQGASALHTSWVMDKILGVLK